MAVNERPQERRRHVSTWQVLREPVFVVLKLGADDLGMHDILNLFFRRSSTIHPSVQTEFLLRLPTELLLQIVSYITNRDDLYSLYATCRTLSLIVRHSLYNCIDTRPPPPPFTGRSIRDDHRPFNAAQHQKIFRTLRSQPHISSLVTELRVALPKCTKDQFKPARGFWTGPKDRCRAIEKHLALALVQLVNLEVLDFQCGLCPIRLDSVSRGKKHDYLCKLGAKHLRELRLSCVCRESRDLAETRTILSAPCLQSITTLSWDIQLSCVQWEVTGDMSQLDQCLLHLHTLSYDTNPLLDRLVTLRRIRHLEASRDEWTPLTALSSPDVARNLRFLVLYRRGHSSLCYYRQPNHSAELWMQTCLPNNAQSYSNLRHVGIFDFFGTPGTRILQEMLPLCSLPHLFSIQVHNYFYEDWEEGCGVGKWYPWSENLLTEISIQHTSLRKVYMSVLHRKRYGFIVWSLTNDVWMYGEIEDITREDMMHCIPP